MKIPDIDRQQREAALGGDLKALDAMLLAIQPGVYNLAVRMLGNRDDAADATQEILLKVVTHLAGFRGEAAFSTWVYQVARNHLLTASTRSRESPEVSLDAIAERLQAGLEFGARQLAAQGERVLTPEDKLAARQTALGCTQNMLMTLDREQRLAYVLDTVFDLPSGQAAEVLGISPAAYRKRVSRARGALDPALQKTCGLANPDAPCRCERQLPALAAAQASRPAGQVRALHAQTAAEIRDAADHLGALMRLSDAAHVFRAHPQYEAPGVLVGAIRAVLGAEGYLGHSAGPLQ